MRETSRKTNIEMSFLIQNLYGDRDYRIFKEFQNISLAKKYYSKIVKSLRFVVEENLNYTDKHHFDAVISLLVNYEKRMRSSNGFSTLDQTMIAFQTELIFLLIGSMPRNWKSNRVINRKSKWKLDKYRQITYNQSIIQKKNLIFYVLQNKYKDRFPVFKDFMSNVYRKECQRDPKKLIDWLKKNHPDIYLNIF